MSFSSLSSESVLSTPWTSGSDEIWSKIQMDCRQLADEFNTLGDRAQLHSENEAKGFSEGANMFLDLLTAYQVDIMEKMNCFYLFNFRNCVTGEKN